jgi:hypothetical protein
MLTDNLDYHDLGGDYFTRRDPESAMRRITRQANALGRNDLTTSLPLHKPAEGSTASSHLAAPVDP